MADEINDIYMPGKTLYVPLYVMPSKVLPIEGQTTNLNDHHLRNASDTPPGNKSKCYMEVEILESTTTSAKLDDDIVDDIGVNLSNYLVQIKNVNLGDENASKFFVSEINEKEKPFKIYAMELPDDLRKIKLHDTVVYGIFKSNKYEFINGEYVVYFPELLVNNINIAKLHELQKDNFQIIYQLTPLQIT